MELSHIGKDGKAKMVDVTEKPLTERTAKAFGQVRLSRDVYELLRDGKGPKGDVLNTAKIAGIMAAKKTPELIPLCHPLMLSYVDLRFNLKEEECVLEIESTVKTEGKTGVEMESLTAVMVAALTVYDMLKAVDKKIELGPFFLVEKEGGKSGRFTR
ncbi:MAG: cyclic pyranopterin monophosphate synthase MoaC [Deltaproteobacteria bacterium]|nr:cyclic pyranopterin monophosphate synthase MoaC [Deltaproteobacteria bacterium]